MDANDAASYVQELTGEEANIIFGAMYDDTVADYCRITVIATGLNDDNLQQTPFGKRSTASSFGARRPSSTATTGTATAGTAAGKRYEHQLQPSNYECHTIWEIPRFVKHCSEEGYPDSGFLKKQIGLSVLQ